MYGLLAFRFDRRGPWRCAAGKPTAENDDAGSKRGSAQRSRIVPAALAGVLATGLLAAAPAVAVAHRAITPTQWNETSDPTALYGFCRAAGSGLGIRSALLRPLGEQLAGVLAITVLQCGPFSGGGGSVKAPCPTGSPYAYCVRNGNDGGGNAVEIGVLRTGRSTDADATYSGCPAGVRASPKVDLLIAAGKDPRMVSGIVTLSCRAGSGAPGVGVVDCPSGPHPYAYCLRATNDGSGAAVTLGVVPAHGPDDPNGLYGECGTAAEGVQNGFARKVTIIAAAGRSSDVAAISLQTCQNRTWGTTPIAVVPCSTPGFDNLAARYDYCIQGLDTRGNFVRAGIILRH